MLDLSALTHEDFARHTGSSFLLLLPAPSGVPGAPGAPAAVHAAAAAAGSAAGIAPAPIPLELVEVTAGHLRPGAARRSFALVFRGPHGLRLVQRIVQLRHDEMGTMELFLVPITPDARGPLYEAVFN
jgi:hypothetical protein